MKESDAGGPRKPRDTRHTANGRDSGAAAKESAAHAKSTSRRGATPAAPEPTPPRSHSARGAQPVAARRERYLVAPLPPHMVPQGAGPVGSLFGGSIGSLVGPAIGTMQGFGAAPTPTPAVNSEQFMALLDADPNVSVTRVLPGSSTTPNLSALGAGPSLGGSSTVDFPHMAIVEMDSGHASTYAAQPALHVEPDLPLRYGADSPAGGLSVADPGLVPYGTELEVDFIVRSTDGKPVPDAEVWLMSPSFPARGVTNATGKATLGTSSTALADATAVYIKPAGDYWTLWMANPHLLTNQPNLITCRRLSETLTGFPDKELQGWGWKAMRFDGLPPTFRGHGVKVAIIDSGAAMTHPDLVGRVTGGRDIAGQNDTGWKVDTVGHGSHCAGIIGGKGNGSGILGLVPEAELHSCKIFPGGRFSDLIEALDYCIKNEIDVVNLSLGTPEPSELVRLKVEQARQAGVACVVAAGNSANAVCFPASMSSVLAVAAIGKLDEYPPDSYHATLTSGIPTADGFFSAKFTCFGPEIDVCAPGVAIVSSVPPDLYAAEDGTSFAGPHVAALAALVLAHHPDFRQQYAQRGAARVDRLFDIIRSSCRPMSFGDPNRSGAGLPDAMVAVGLGNQQPFNQPSVQGIGAPVTVPVGQGFFPNTTVPSGPNLPPWLAQALAVAAGNYGGQPYPYPPQWTSPNGPVQGQPFHGQPFQGQQFQGQQFQGQPFQAQPFQAQPFQAQPFQAQPVQGQPSPGQPSQAQPVFQPQSAGPGPATGFGPDSPGGSDPLEQLRVALRAAGLLGAPAPHTGRATVDPSHNGHAG